LRLNGWFDFLEVDGARHCFAGLSDNRRADGFQAELVVERILAFGEGATNDAPGPERRAGHMTSGV
jgi:hypothetical protein